MRVKSGAGKASEDSQWRTRAHGLPEAGPAFRVLESGGATVKRSVTLVISAGAGLVLLAAGTAAGAAITGGPIDNSGVIHGCWTNAAINGSHVFVLQDAGTSCPKGTTAISWNQQGPAGPAGATGPAGPAGATGPAGPAGATGPAGPAGPKGDTGAQGPAGPAGATGPAGPAGADGTSVLNGTGAPTGTIGHDGDFYLDTQAEVLYGPKVNGAWPQNGTSLTGPAGAAGPAGPAGPAGAAGPTGPQGLMGPQGPAGTDGNTVLNGTAPPTGSVGHDGDFYIDTQADVLYGPKVAGAWPATGTNLTGPAGPQGAQGPQGPAGPAGTTGQQSVTTDGNSALTVTPSFSFTLIPGLTQSVTVPANGRVLISTYGGVATQATFSSGFSEVGIQVFVDGVGLQDLAQLVAPANTSGLVNDIQNWSMTGTAPLSAGQHTIAVGVEDIQGSPATVGGGSGNFLRPGLTVTILNT